jgi:Domain of unknown function (DUF4166)
MAASSSPAPPEPYIAALGDAAARVSPVVLDLHRFRSPARYAGRARVTRGANPLARLVATVMGMPPTMDDCPVEVRLTRDERGVETWTRTFGSSSFSSTHSLGQGRWAGLVVERFGPIAVAMAVAGNEGRLRLAVRGWSKFGVQLPLSLGPKVEAFEHGADGRFNFNVVVRLALVGLVVQYRGWLLPVG